MSSYINSLINFADNSLTKIGKTLEVGLRNCRDIPHYKYLTRPIYKSCVNKVGPVMATAISFLTGELIIHQLLPQTAYCLSSYVLTPHNVKEDCDFSWYPLTTVLWMSFAIPVMYVKYKQK